MEVAYFTKQFTEAEENAVRAYEIAQHNHVPAKLPVQVPCRHLVNVIQLADNFDDQLKIISRTVDLSGADEESIKRIKKRCECMRFWLDKFAPDMVKFSVLKEAPADLKIQAQDKEFLQALVAKMNDCNWDATEVNNLISETGKASPLGSKGAYKLIYLLIIGKERGPRLGPFLASMDKQFVLDRFSQAAAN